MAIQHWLYWIQLRHVDQSALQWLADGTTALARLLKQAVLASKRSRRLAAEAFIRRVLDLGDDPPTEEGEEEWWMQWAALQVEWEEWQLKDAEAWGLRSKAQWTLAAGRMTNTFFRRLRTRQPASAMMTLQPPFQQDGPVAEDTQHILHFAHQYYSYLLPEEQPWTPEEIAAEPAAAIWQKITTALTDSDSAELDGPIMEHEVCEALADLPAGKAPGPDGMPVEHLKSCLDVLLLHLLEGFNDIRLGAWPRNDHSSLRQRRFGPRFLSMVRCLLASTTSRLLINDYVSDPIAITRSVRQGCPLSPALYALYVEHLHDMLRADDELEGLKLPGGRQLKSSALADDTGAVTATTLVSVRALRTQVGTFEKFAGARMNWHKTVALVPDLNAAPLFEEMRVQPMTEAASYLGIKLPRALTDGSQMEQLMRKAATRLAFRRKTLDAGIFGRVLLANTAASAMLWYAAPVSTQDPVPQREYRTALSKFVWKNDPFAPHAIHQVAWRKLIQPKAGRGLGLIDPATQIQALQLRTVIWLLLEQDDAPWKLLTLQTMAEAARLHPTDMELALLQPAILTGLKRGALWSPFLKAWRDLAPLELEPPSSLDHILQQPLFGNPRIRDSNGERFPWAGARGAFGKAWLRAGVAIIADLWDLQTNEWQQESALLKQLDGQTHKQQRLHQIQQAIPKEWLAALRARQRFDGEWVVLSTDNSARLLFQITARVGESWLVVEAWENPPSDTALGPPLVCSPSRDGWVPRDLVRSVSVVTDRRGLARRAHHAFRQEKRPAQLALDPAMWQWRKQGLQCHDLPLHQVSTKVIYRSLTTPYRID
ncbi:hypothetical protein CBR_g30672 [Chara braunii]|uniref:Reverse transcriptase domain-containing protein n=1 Tax=Chara braunii TaxID=69332 RepID=A0A388LDB9_CHABU|nr:hypothetical protein CBR_g30672 [Chara braunii]|eukprot:GBG80304.1 hypothetical protein CBR_g30672 [Chara braunii]